MTPIEELLKIVRDLYAMVSEIHQEIVRRR
jgi:hypothetical protein